MSFAHSSNHKAMASYRNGNLEVIDCECCGYRHLWPIPSEKEVRETYERRFGGSIRSHFVEKKREDAEHWQRVFQRRLGQIREHRGQKPGRILDVGCGVGDYLAFMSGQGWEVYGIEPSDSFHGELAQRSVPVLPKLVEDISDDDWSQLGQFDVINMSQFLEHVRDPRAILSAVEKALRPAGLLVIECPNDFNEFQLAAVVSQDIPMWWISPLHINYFDFEALERLCRSVGCEPVGRSTQFPLEMFLHFGDVYVGNAELGREVHKKRMAFEDSLTRSGHGKALEDLYDALAGCGLGRHATVVARKQPGVAGVVTETGDDYD
ncbi:class I SAM-dependent methyltransferase [Marinobacter xestospongiae]|uniref:Class I SAM-dependent methyltransferase n=1 Tax=Marinobacter xestospongiae TaxID=994319 RepID=A0ABU3W095_9GAMM|nr:class I SAM-dependent methyltransferase [Marinobacter xestospongiae]MDV2079965.1 class I SAM-dependent methyltransferase [Marinobacter xestospongiae]